MFEGHAHRIPARSRAIVSALLFVLLAAYATSARALVCMAPHNDDYRFSTNIPANICTDAAAAYPDGNGSRTKIECRDGVCPADTAIDVIWQNPGLTLPTPGLDAYSIGIRADSAFATATIDSCVFPTFPQPRINFSPYWKGGSFSDPICNDESATAGWKSFAAAPFVGFGETPNPESNFLMMTLTFQSLTSTTTISYDFDGGGVYVIRTSDGKNIAGCATSRYNQSGCTCSEETRDTDGCLEMDVVYAPTPAVEACTPTGAGISWATPTGCLTATSTVVPTIGLTASRCRAWPGGVCGDTACPGACEYTVKLNGQTVARRAETTIPLPPVRTGSAEAYTVIADCGGHPDPTGATISVTAPNCDSAPRPATDSLKLSGVSYPFTAGGFKIGTPLILSGTVIETDSGETASQAKVYVYFGSDSGVSTAPLETTPDAMGGFSVAIPASATALLGESNLYIGIAAQDHDGVGSCFTSLGYQAAETSVCGYLPQNLRLNATSTAFVVSNSLFVKGVSCPPDPCAMNPACNFVISAPAGSLKQINPTLPMVDCDAGKCYVESTLAGAAVRIYDMRGPGDTDDRAVTGKECVSADEGGFSARVDPADVETLDGKKKVRLALMVLKSIAEANRFPCDKQTTDPDLCITTLVKNIEVNDAGEDYVLNDLPRLPKGIGGKEIGNIYCDTMAGESDGTDAIDIGDFNRLKAHYGTRADQCACPTLCTLGQGKDKCYAPFADINGDGKIDIADYAVLKTYFKKSVFPAPTVKSRDAAGADLCTTE